MAVSVRMQPLLEKELEGAAPLRGVTKPPFIIQAVARALGRKDPYPLARRVRAEAAQDPQHQVMREAFEGHERPHDTVKSRDALLPRLRARHGVGAG